MDELEMVKIAKNAIAQDMTFVELMFSEEVINQRYLALEIWEYVIQCRTIGEKAFYEMYP